jgi:hypothetical protein
VKAGEPTFALTDRATGRLDDDWIAHAVFLLSKRYVTNDESATTVFGRVVEVLQVADDSDVSLVHAHSLESYLEARLEQGCWQRQTAVVWSQSSRTDTVSRSTR